MMMIDIQMIQIQIQIQKTFICHYLQIKTDKMIKKIKIKWQGTLLRQTIAADRRPPWRHLEKTSSIQGEHRLERDQYY